MNKLFISLLGIVICNCSIGQKKAGIMTITFELVSKGETNILNKKLVNDFGENYTISKLKYYISNVTIESGEKRKTTGDIYLIDASKKNIISLIVSSKNITGLSFLLGVDSALNCSGAQSGALDPLNDMFWTWNNGYVFFKIEGNCEASKADLHRIEHHIGGFKGTNKTMREIYFPIKNKNLLKNKVLVVQLDIDKYWNGKNKLRMAEMPVIKTAGVQAKNAADNFDVMFSIKDNK